MKTDKKEIKLTLKMRKWLKSYLVCFNKTQAARDAGYKCKGKTEFANVGQQNYIKLYSVIEKWLAEEGLSDDRIKAKIANGFEAKETKFFADKGVITDQVEVEALGIQAKYVDMAARVKGLYATEKHQHEIKYEDRLRRMLGIDDSVSGEPES